MEPKNIFIAGGGPVGLAAALELSRRNIPVRIVDPDAAVSPQSRALAVSARTLDLMEASGATEMMLAAGHRVNRMIIRKPGRTLASIDLRQIRHRFNFLLVLAQSGTEEILASRLKQFGVKLERKLALDSFKEGKSIALTLSDGSLDSATCLIGADGAHSPVRKSLGLNFDGETDSGTFGLADVELDDWPFAFDSMVLTVMDNHLAPFIPMANGMGRFITTRPDCLNNLPGDARVRRVLWESDFSISYRQVQRYQKDNVFLAGDAAHIHSPVGGRGMNLGIEDACWLAWLIEQNRQDEYTSLRHPVGASVLKYTARFTAFARARGPLQDFFLGCVLPVLIGIPKLRNRVFSMLTALDTPPPAWR